ncbi:receptor-like protein 12 [Asparagus officinalis]|nr:receptor-like protein 12 [Asparagus officinalis]
MGIEIPDYPKARGPPVSWKPGSNCCDWEGVTCDPKSGHVSGLGLSQRGINGKLSASLFNLISLRTLDLSYNFFQGYFPQVGFENLTQLTRLNLSLAGFSGQIPVGISRLTDLISLDLSLLSNVYSTHYLSEHDYSGDYVQLRHLSFRTLVGNLSNLRELDLDGIDMSSNLDWGSALSTSMPHLQVLSLRGCNLPGSISQTLLNCGSLKVLDLGNNQIVRGFPSWLGQMIFDLSSNHLSENLPSNCFNNLKSMMSFSTKNLSDDIIDKDGYNYEVSVTTNGYEYTFLRILAISYTFVDFSNNNFDGNIPKVIGNLGGLFMLNLSQNSLTGEIPSVIGNMRQLERLDLSANHLSGQIPQELTSLTFLTSLNLSSNNLTGRIPQSNQFYTFSNASYLDNDGLCGNTLSKQCNNRSPNQTSAVQPTASDHSSPSTYIIVLALLIGLGFGVGFAVTFMLRIVQMKFWKRQNTTSI